VITRYQVQINQRDVIHCSNYRYDVPYWRSLTEQNILFYDNLLVKKTTKRHIKQKVIIGHHMLDNF